MKRILMLRLESLRCRLPMMQPQDNIPFAPHFVAPFVDFESSATRSTASRWGVHVSSNFSPKQMSRRDGSNRSGREPSVSDLEWDVLEFVQRFRNGEFDGQLGETISSLSAEQIEDIQHFLLREGESHNRIVP